MRMLDAAFIALGLVLMGACLAYAAACEWL